MIQNRLKIRWDVTMAVDRIRRQLLGTLRKGNSRSQLIRRSTDGSVRLLVSGNAHALEQRADEGVTHVLRGVRNVETVAILFPYTVMVAASLLKGFMSP